MMSSKIDLYYSIYLSSEMTTEEVQIEMEAVSEFQKLYDDYTKSSHEDYPKLHRRAMAYKQTLLSQPNDSELKQVNHFMTELSNYHATVSMIDMKQRMFVLSVIGCIAGPASFIGGILGINIEIPYQQSSAYNAFFAVCVFCLWSSIVIGLYLYRGMTTRNIILSSIITLCSFTLMAMFLWVIGPIYDIGYQVGDTS